MLLALAPLLAVGAAWAAALRALVWLCKWWCSAAVSPHCINSSSIFQEQQHKQAAGAGGAAAAAAAAPRHDELLQPAASTPTPSCMASAPQEQQHAAEEAAFAAAFARHGYGYDASLAALRSSQFPQAAAAGSSQQPVVYLDHAAATLPSVQQLQAAHAEQLARLFANPHSQLPPSLDATPAAVEELRLLTLRMLRAPAAEYEVVFTAGATAALKLAGEAFPWTRGSSTCAHLATNHNSALGVRQLAAAAGARVQTVPLQQLVQLQRQQQPSPCAVAEPSGRQQRAQALPEQQPEQQQPAHSLFVMPAECNFSGARYDCVPLFHAWREQQQQRWLLLVDAAKACASHPPDCSGCGVDMLALSFYKIFGHPTGLGALVVRRRLLPLLLAHKTYFGGGTVEVVAPDTCHVVRRAGAAGLEDGTLPFTAIAAARHGFAQLQRLGGFPAIGRHMACLTWHLLLQLHLLRHGNGRPVVVLYCPPEVLQLLEQHAAQHHQHHHHQQQPSSSSSSSSSSTSPGTAAAAAPASAPAPPAAAVLARLRELQGPCVAFNLLHPDGSWVGHKEVGRLAAIHGICLRTGCFCNPGACAHYLGLTSDDMLAHHAAGHVCWDDTDVIAGRPTGAVRVSLGYMSSARDVAALLELLRQYFVVAAAAAPPAHDERSSISGRTAATPPASDRQHQVWDSAGSHTSSDAAAAAAAGGQGKASSGTLSGLFLYPIKSCAAQRVPAWPLGPHGLLYDREWALCAPDGAVLSQKRVPRLALLQPHVDLQAQVMRLSAPGLTAQLVVPLLEGAASGDEAAGSASKEQRVRVCGDSVCTHAVAGRVVASAASSGSGSSGCGDAGAVEQWLLDALGVPCMLVRKASSSSSRSIRRHDPQQQQQSQDGGSSSHALGFANEGQFLLVSEGSIDCVAQQLAAAGAGGSRSSCSIGGGSGVVDAPRFRPNLVVSGFAAWAEDDWTAVIVGQQHQQQLHEGPDSSAQQQQHGDASVRLAVVGPCGRCDMVSIDQHTGQREGSALLALLARQRRAGGKLRFGVLLAHGGEQQQRQGRWLRVGDPVVPVVVGGHH